MQTDVLHVLKEENGHYV